jgi:hypothetical protein
MFVCLFLTNIPCSPSLYVRLFPVIFSTCSHNCKIRLGRIPLILRAKKPLGDARGYWSYCILITSLTYIFCKLSFVIKSQSFNCFLPFYKKYKKFCITMTTSANTSCLKIMVVCLARWGVLYACISGYSNLKCYVFLM